MLHAPVHVYLMILLRKSRAGGVDSVCVCSSCRLLVPNSFGQRFRRISFIPDIIYQGVSRFRSLVDTTVGTKSIDSAVVSALS